MRLPPSSRARRGEPLAEVPYTNLPTFQDTHLARQLLTWLVAPAAKGEGTNREGGVAGGAGGAATRHGGP